MAQNEKPKKSQDNELLQKLFGDLSDLSDEELDLLYGAASSSADPMEVIYRIASQAAVEYRKQNVPVPEHVQAALNASRSHSSLEGAGPSFFQRVVEKLKTPFAGSIADPAHAYRNLTQLSHGDRTILNELTDELGRDWESEEPK